MFKLTGESKNPTMPMRLLSKELFIVATVYADDAIAGAVYAPPYTKRVNTC